MKKPFKKIVCFIFLSICIFIFLSLAFIKHNLRPKYSYDEMYIAKTNLGVQFDSNFTPRLVVEVTITERGKDNSEYTLERKFRVIDWGRGIVWDRRENRLWIYEDQFIIISYTKEEDIWKEIKYVRTHRGGGREILEGMNGDIIINIEDTFPVYFNNLIHDERRLKNWIPW